MVEGERELIERAQSGEEGALSALLVGHAPALRRRLTGRIPARWRSLFSEEDLLQQTYADAFLGIKSFVRCGDEAFGAWLWTLARNNLRDAVRLLSAQKRGGDLQRAENGTDSLALLYEELAASSQTSPSRHARREEGVAALTAAIEELPSTYRVVVRRYDLEGCSIEELAAELGRSPGAVYLLRNRAHRRLGELLGDDSRFFTRIP